jgi:protein O-GlcNAc transferase
MNSAAHIQKLIDQGHRSFAEKELAVALRKNPDDPNLHLLGAKLDFFGRRLDVALSALAKVTKALPDSADAHHLQGVILGQAGQHVAAVSALERAYQLSPNDSQICSNLGAMIQRQGNFNDAEPLLLKARNLHPAVAGFRNNLGLLYRSQLRHQEAVQEQRQAVVLEPGRIDFRKSLVWAMDYCPNTDPHDDFEAIRATGELIENNTPLLFDTYEKVKGRIRIGYLGSTLRKHSVAYFLLPIIEKHTSQFEIFSYHIGELEDSMTRRIAEASDHYRHLSGQSAKDIAHQIHKDGINILVDLEGFSEQLETLPVLAHSPAPVQVSYLGWPNTTGLARVDYRFVDNFTDPPESIADSIYTEQLIRMSASFAVYSAPTDAPDVNATPVLKNGYITFGSFNWSAKMNPEVIKYWALILKAVPDSKLLLKHTSFDLQSVADIVLSAFSAWDVGPERLILDGFSKDTVEHLSRYHEVDIALDPFPFNGMTTSCEALWMGVPVVTLAGERHLSRVGVSLMNNIGYPDWIADDYNGYVAIATKLASDPERLQTIRTGLRKQMSDSPLMDGKKFVEEFEQRLIEISHDG